MPELRTSRTAEFRREALADEIRPPHQAYVAGIIDGEGSIFCRGFKSHREVKSNPHVTVANTSRSLILALVTLGGHVCERQGRGLGHKQGWDWAITGEAAAIVLEQVRPYLIVKRCLADVALTTWAEAGHATSHEYHRDRAREHMARIGWLTPPCS